MMGETWSGQKHTGYVLAYAVVALLELFIPACCCAQVTAIMHAEGAARQVAPTGSAEQCRCVCTHIDGSMELLILWDGMQAYLGVAPGRGVYFIRTVGSKKV